MAWLIGRLFPALWAGWTPTSSPYLARDVPPLLVGFSLIGLALVQTSCTAVVLNGHLWTAIVNPNS
jgi:glycerol uptake facilitator-like aquaporin